MCDVLSDCVLVFWTQVRATEMYVFKQRDLLGIENVHHVRLLVEYYSFNRKKILAFKQL